MESLSVQQLAQWLDDPARPRPLLLDVREPWEQALCRIDGSVALPLRELPQQAGALGAEQPDRPIVCICHHGVRSAQAAVLLARQGLAAVYSLDGGIDAWARQIDRTMATY